MQPVGNHLSRIRNCKETLCSHCNPLCSVCISKLDDNYLQTFKAAQSERRHTKLARCCLETGCLPSANLCNYNKHPQVEGFVH